MNKSKPATIEKKHILSSKTLWFNLATAAFAVLSSHTELLHSYLSDGGYLGVMMFVAMVNVYLRSITTQSVHL